MPGRRRNCTACGGTWRGEDARFCGSCGATLDGADAPHPESQGRGRRPTLGRVVVIAALAAVVVAGVFASGTDLPRPGGGPDDTVDLDEEPPTADSPLSEDEAAGRLADTAALRCEPHGCELWRLDVGDQTGDGAVAGVAQIGDVVLLPTARNAGAPTDAPADAPEDAPEDAPADDAVAEGAPDEDTTGGDEGMTDGDLEVTTPPAQGDVYRFTALDLDTGEPRWEHEVAAGVGGVRVIGAGELGVLVTGDTILALDEDGEVRWEWSHHTEGDGEVEQSIQGITHDDERLVFAAHRTGGDGGAALVALDLATGELRWEREQLLASHAWPDVVVEVDRDGQLRQLDLATGEARWEADGGFDDVSIADGYLLGHSRSGQLSVLDPEDGDTLVELEEVVAAGTMIRDDAVFAVVLPDSDPQDIDQGMFTPTADDPTLEAVRIGLDGDERWRTELPVDGIPNGCCGFHRASDDEVGVTVDGDLHHLDAADGELLGTGDLAAESSGTGAAEANWITAPSGLELRTSAQGQRLDLRTPDGARARVSSDQQVHLMSEDPLVVTDGATFLGVEPLDDDGAEDG